MAVDARLPVGGSEAIPQLVAEMQALASPIRFALVERLQRPAFLPDLAKEFGVTRQAMDRHLRALMTLGLVEAEASRRRALPATKYHTHAAGLFAFKQRVRALAISTDPASLRKVPTARIEGTKDISGGRGPYLLMVDGDLPGRCFPLLGTKQWTIGRGPASDVVLAYDPYASTRHCSLRREAGTWTIMDLHSMNGTRVNFQPIPPGSAQPLATGDLLMVGRTILALREES